MCPQTASASTSPPRSVSVCLSSSWFSECLCPTSCLFVCLCLTSCLFVCPQGSLSVSQLQQVERCVNDVVSANQIVHSEELPLQRARSISGLRTVDEVSCLHLSVSWGHGSPGGLSVLFWCPQVYPDPVRVVSVDVPVSELFGDQVDKETSVELCCGT